MDLGQQTLHDFIRTRCIKIDAEVFDLLWKISEGDCWIPLDRAIIKRYLTTASCESAVSLFHERKLSKFKVNADYKPIEWPPGSNKPANAKYFAVTKKTFILLLCKANLPESMRFLECLYEIQDLMIAYYKHQASTHTHSIESLLGTPAIVEHTRSQSAKYAEQIASEQVGYIYFIHELGDLTCFKIGYAQDVEKRLKCLQTGNHRQLVCRCTISSDDMPADEAHLHMKYGNYATRGEWFNITAEQVDEACEYMKGRNAGCQTTPTRPEVTVGLVAEPEEKSVGPPRAEVFNLDTPEARQKFAADCFAKHIESLPQPRPPQITIYWVDFQKTLIRAIGCKPAQFNAGIWKKDAIAAAATNQRIIFKLKHTAKP